MVWYIIANPTAGNGAVARQWLAIEQQLQAMGFSYTVQMTKAKGHATRLAEDAILNGHRNLLGIGGDGTNHEIINGIMAQKAVPTHEINYALLPIGVGNDWARTYYLPRTIEQRLKHLQTPVTRLQDVGHVKYQTLDGQTAERYFANVAGMAYDGYVVKRLEEEGKSSSKMVYMLAVARYLMDYQLSECRIEWDGHEAVDYFYTINIGICKYSGGGMQFVPHAIPDDGLLALTFARRLARWEVLLQTPRFYNGTLLEHPKLTGVQTKRVTVTPLRPSEAPVYIEADGELLGVCSATFDISVGALRVVV